ncbi:hypothetical protein AMTRI_Chr06g174330 [Amborella trichopoda]|uniref:probable inactive leucine-rich repeat receptor-like protein kinase At3g03770 isoform X1 n=1 Tax=Amborella trichopoda TaxID=13333 RepID=UPI0009BD8D4F|nr:probable inactive leucine-rich repeat receptor-like protein kinase At3g03770 isoform X1 [Amborella trichopoda]|eukprot:XP_020523436.1 probable inactive leucine-rich repeat receptor-like protein kinase At3g03770 isoform X1 [Amborella trichopoda]
MAPFLAVVLLLFSWVFFFPISQPLPSSQTQILQQLRRHLEYPQALNAWNITTDLCYSPSSSKVSIVCKDDSVIELRIVGEKPVKYVEFDGFPISGQTLSDQFSMDSFIITLCRLNSLRVVSMVSLGIWGPLSDKIHRLSSIEILDFGSNFLFGSVPQKISNMERIQTLKLDNNFFNDTLPNWFDSFQNLSVLSLNKNRFKGPVPPSMAKIKTLQVLALSENSLSGNLPELKGLTGLQSLDLRGNRLGPHLPELPAGVITVLLSKNLFSSEVPPEYGELDNLQHLDLSFNFVDGVPPPMIFSLPNITYVNLASNSLSGALPGSLRCSSSLGFVDVSSNRLSGALPSCLGSEAEKRVVKFAGNCLYVNSQHQHQASYCQGFGKSTEQTVVISLGILIGIIGGIALFLLVLVFVALILCKRCCKREISEQNLIPKTTTENSPTGFSTELLANATGFISQTMKLGAQGLPVYRSFLLEELEEATRNFDHSTYLGEGSIGKLYKGSLENGTYVVIRCLELSKRYSIRNLKLRLDLLSKLRHPNLVCLLGHCLDSVHDPYGVKQVFLVYEYIPSGNLQTHLSGYIPEKSLSWPARLNILVGVAKAVHFLHTRVIPGFFNNRLKVHNIFLDEHATAKLSDYGLAIITEEIEKHEGRIESQKSVHVDPRSCMRKNTNLEDDIYGFGFILLKVLVGPTTIEREHASLLNEMARSFSSSDERKRIVDPIVLGTSGQESLSVVISITNRCLSPEPSARPSIEDILWNLQYAAQVQATADGDRRSEDSSCT